MYLCCSENDLSLAAGATVDLIPATQTTGAAPPTGQGSESAAVFVPAAAAAVSALDGGENRMMLRIPSTSF